MWFKKNIKENNLFFSIRNKLIILFFIIALLPVILGYVTLFLYQSSITEQVHSSHTAIEESLVKLVDHYVVGCQKIIIDASFQPTVISGMSYWNIPKLNKRFSSIHRKFKNFTFILAEDKYGRVKACYPRNNSIIGKKFTSEVNLNTKKPGISDVFYSNYISDLSIIIVFAPVKNSNGTHVGTLIGGIDLVTLSKMLDKVKPSKDSYIFIVDKKGTVLAHPDKRMLLSNLSENNEVVKKVMNNIAGIDKTSDYKGNKMLASYKLTPLSGWGVILHDPLKKAYSNLLQLKTFFMILTLIGLGISLYFSIRLSNMFTKPIHELQHGAEMIGAGNLNYRLNIKTRDEIEKLANEFNNMAVKLNESYGGLGEKIHIATRDLKDAHSEIEDKNSKLKETDRLKSQFLANMSHELRTPMNAIIGFSSLMEEKIYGDINEKQEDALKKIGKNAKALLQLINDILDLSKIEAGKIVLSFDEFDLKLLIEEITVTMEPLLKGNNFKLENIFEGDIPKMYSDRDRLKQIIVNLLTNSIKFTKEGRISIFSKSVKDKIIITVEDTGIGIEKDALPYIFEEFRQVDGSSTRQYGGTGLGLSITHKLLELLGGEIKAESIYGKGTKMIVKLPVKVKKEDDNEESVVG